MFLVKENGIYYNQFPSLARASDCAEGLFLASDDAIEKQTFTVVNEANNCVIASFTHRKIISEFTKQIWSGRRSDNAEFVGIENFDATDAILRMPHARLIKVRDNSIESDEIGHALVQWDGPCEVKIADSICAYFGVTKIQDITESNFNFVNDRIVASKRSLINDVTSKNVNARPLESLDFTSASPAQLNPIHETSKNNMCDVQVRKPTLR